MYNISITEAIKFNDIGVLKSLVDRQYYNASIPTISKEQIEIYKLTCIYSGNPHLVSVFAKK